MTCICMLCSLFLAGAKEYRGSEEGVVVVVIPRITFRGARDTTLQSSSNISLSSSSDCAPSGSASRAAGTRAQCRHSSAASPASSVAAPPLGILARSSAADHRSRVTYASVRVGIAARSPRTNAGTSMRAAVVSAMQGDGTGVPGGFAKRTAMRRRRRVGEGRGIVWVLQRASVTTHRRYTRDSSRREQVGALG